MTGIRSGMGTIVLLLFLVACGSPEATDPPKADRERSGSERDASSEPSGPRTLRAGCETDCAPDFAVTTFEGSRFELSSRLGKVVVLNFWESW